MIELNYQQVDRDMLEIRLKIVMKILKKKSFLVRKERRNVLRQERKKYPDLHLYLVDLFVYYIYLDLFARECVLIRVPPEY